MSSRSSPTFSILERFSDDEGADDRQDQDDVGRDQDEIGRDQDELARDQDEVGRNQDEADQDEIREPDVDEEGGHVGHLDDQEADHQAQHEAEDLEEQGLVDQQHADNIQQENNQGGLDQQDDQGQEPQQEVEVPIDYRLHPRESPRKNKGAIPVRYGKYYVH